MMGELAPLEPRIEYRILDDLEGIRASLRRLEADRSEVARLEPWLSKRDLANYLGCGVRWIEERVGNGMPKRKIAGGLKFRVSEVEPWLRHRGLLEDE